MQLSSFKPISGTRGRLAGAQQYGDRPARRRVVDRLTGAIGEAAAWINSELGTVELAKLKHYRVAYAKAPGSRRELRAPVTPLHTDRALPILQGRNHAIGKGSTRAMTYGGWYAFSAMRLLISRKTQHVG
jgi:hypothetical protein